MCNRLPSSVTCRDCVCARVKSLLERQNHCAGTYSLMSFEEAIGQFQEPDVPSTVSGSTNIEGCSKTSSGT